MIEAGKAGVWIYRRFPRAPLSSNQMERAQAASGNLGAKRATSVVRARYLPSNTLTIYNRQSIVDHRGVQWAGQTI